MVRNRSKTAAELDALVAKVVSGIQSGLYKSLYEAAKVLKISKDIVTQRVNGGLTRSEARQNNKNFRPHKRRFFLSRLRG